METYKCINLVFLLFCIMSVQTAPRKFIEIGHSYSIFTDKSNHRNLNPIQYVQKPTNLIPQSHYQQPRIQENKKFNRFPHMDDVRQNWGILVNGSTFEDEDEKLYKRPINIPMPSIDNPMKQSIDTANVKSKATPLTVAQTSSNSEVSEKAQLTLTSGLKKQVKLTSCDVARIVCCMGNNNLKQCFTSNNCYKKVVPETTCQINEILTFLRTIKDR
nr:uncharacterized protein LOC113401357 isoform X2 [Vanessa tameamea]